MAGLLVSQALAPVKFTQAAQGLVKEGAKAVRRGGPGNVLSGLLREGESTRP